VLEGCSDGVSRRVGLRLRGGKTRRFLGLEHRDLDGVEAIGVDEVQWRRGHKYQTVVYQLDEGKKRLLWVGPGRTAKTLLRFFRMLGKERSAALQFVCSDMWQPEPKFTHEFV